MAEESIRSPQTMWATGTLLGHLCNLPLTCWASKGSLFRETCEDGYVDILGLSQGEQ